MGFPPPGKMHGQTEYEPTQHDPPEQRFSPKKYDKSDGHNPFDNSKPRRLCTAGESDPEFSA